MSDCIFCGIVSGAVPCKKVMETESLLAFHDIRPRAPVHVQIIPKEHIPSVNDITEKHSAVTAGLIAAAREIAGKLNLSRDGYRLVINCGRDAGQDVPHLHLHLLGGRPLGWPPG